MFILVDIENHLNDYFPLDEINFDEYDAYKIPFNTYFDEDMNNISLQDQNIRIGSANIKAIHFSGFGELSNYNDNIRFIFENGESENVNVFDSCYDTSRNNINTRWDFIEKSSCQDICSLGVNRKLFCITLELKKDIQDKKLMYLELPFNPNIHIFSVTYEI